MYVLVTNDLLGAGLKGPWTRAPHSHTALPFKVVFAQRSLFRPESAIIALVMRCAAVKIGSLNGSWVACPFVLHHTDNILQGRWPASQRLGQYHPISWSVWPTDPVVQLNRPKRGRRSRPRLGQV